MRRDHAPTMAGLAIAAMALSGCGEDPGIENGPVPFKGTDTSSLERLRDEMTRQMQKPSPPKKEAEARPAAPPPAAGRPSPAGPPGAGAPTGGTTKGG